MRRETKLFLAALGLLAPLSLTAQAQNASTDILKDAIEPFNSGNERARFLQAVGVDPDLDESEFNASAAKPNGFVRKFDTWAAIKGFDKNTNNKIDWFEASAYRAALKIAVVKLYDKNANNKLDGDELTAAATDLAAGKAPKVAPPATAAPVAGAPAPTAPRTPGQPGGNRFQQADTDGDGQISDAEREAARAARGQRGREQFEQARQNFLTNYDKDGNGKISEAERAAMPIQEQWQSRVMDIAVNTFDDNGNGKVDPEEEQVARALGQKAQAAGRELEVKLLDANGDGQVDQSERQAVQQQLQGLAFTMLPKLISWNDANGDGQVDDAERQAGMQRVSKAAEVQLAKWTKKFDANGDGRLGAGEREAFIDGMRADILERLERNKVGGAGKLDPAGVSALIEELAGEFGVKPQ